MLFSTEQIQELLHIIDNHANVFIASTLGHEYLTKDEIEKLKKVGIDATKLYNIDSDLIKQSFHFGLISDALGEDANKITFDDLKKYFNEGNFIPLTETEKYALDSVKKQSLRDIRANQGRIFNDVNNIIQQEEKNNRTAYENVIREEVKEGIIKNKSVGEISREIARKTGDWSRDYRKSVEYVSHLAMSEGMMASIERKGGKKCYVIVYEGACKNCVRLYLTNGVGSKPKIFTIEELKNNGTNIGRKVEDWLPVIPGLHVFCRCHLVEFREGSVWDEKLKRFELGKKPEITGRKPIKFIVKIGGKEKEYFV